MCFSISRVLVGYFSINDSKKKIKTFGQFWQFTFFSDVWIPLTFFMAARFSPLSKFQPAARSYKANSIIFYTLSPVVAAAASTGGTAGGRAAAVPGAKRQLFDGRPDVFQPSAPRPRRL